MDSRYFPEGTLLQPTYSYSSAVQVNKISGETLSSFSDTVNSTAFPKISTVDPEESVPSSISKGKTTISTENSHEKVISYTILHPPPFFYMSFNEVTKISRDWVLNDSAPNAHRADRSAVRYKLAVIRVEHDGEKEVWKVNGKHVQLLTLDLHPENNIIGGETSISVVVGRITAAGYV